MAATTSLEAYRYYSLGVEKAEAYHDQQAIELLKRAIAIDPQFAMASCAKTRPMVTRPPGSRT